MRIEIRTFSELEMSDRGIEGTDVAIAVAVDGKIVGYTDDYCTFIPFKRDDVEVNKLCIERLVDAAGDVWTRRRTP